MGMIEMFKVTIIVMLFYSASIDILIYSMPDLTQYQITAFYDSSGSMDLQTVSDDISGSLERQTEIPVIELGALVFYSGNIILDLLLNFAFAIPQMFGFLVTGFLMLFGINSELFVIVQLFFTVLITSLYIIGLIQLVTNIRSTGKVV